MQRDRLVAHGRPAEGVSHARFVTTLAALAGVAWALGSVHGEVLNTALYPYSCDVTFSGYAGQSTLANFPALVRIPADSAVYRDYRDGSDIRFTDTAGNLVPHEINTWNYGGESLVWVRVPALSGTTTKLKLYFGALNPAQTTDPGEVWTAAGYRGVWHFEGSCAESSTNHLYCYDSKSASGAYPSYTAAGSVGKCMSTKTGCVMVQNDARWAAFPTNTCTVSAWVKYNGTAWDGLTPRYISCKKAWHYAAGFEGHKTKKVVDTITNMAVNAISSGASQNTMCTPDYSAEPVYLTLVFSNSRTMAYTNGYVSTDVASSKLVSTLTNLCIGAQASNASFWNGTLDEVRLQWAAPSADWAAADYATQTSPTFAVLSAPERLGTKIVESDYSHKATITFSGYTGTTALYNFPTLVRIPASCGLVADVPGGNLRFADADGYLIPHELDTWYVDGSALVWVCVPKIVGTDTKITVYGGAKASAPSPLAAGKVWSPAGYQGVWHFSSKGADSSANDFAYTNDGGVQFVTNGVVGGASSYSEKQMITIANDARWTQYPSNALTVSAWVKSDASNCGRILAAKLNYNDELGFEFTMQNATNKLNAIGHGGNQNVVTLKDGLNFDDDYVYATAVYKDGNSSIYANGKLVGTTTSGNFCVYPADKALTIGKMWKGTLDEVRLQWAAQSADWAKADYEAQKPDSTFATFGAVEDIGATTLDPALYQRRATVTFSGYVGSTTLANFPALVRVPAHSPLYSGSQSDGSDLRFTDLDNNLVPHEVECWNKAGESLVWVRVPKLTGTTTQLRVYFKPMPNAVVPAARSCGEVWGPAGYKGVWHFAGSAADSSPNNLAAVASNVTYPIFGPLGQAFQSKDGLSAGGYVRVADTSWWSGFDGRALVVSAWVHNSVASDGVHDRIVSTKLRDTEVAGFEVTRQYYTNKVNANGNRTGNYQHTTYIDPYNLNTQTVYTTFIFGDGYYDTFVNGTRMGTPLAAPAILTPTNALYIGSLADGCGNMWHGQIDEVRLRWLVSSEDWIKADFDTQNPEGNFAEIGAVERLRENGVIFIVQ